MHAQGTPPPKKHIQSKRAGVFCGVVEERGEGLVDLQSRCQRKGNSVLSLEAQAQPCNLSWSGWSRVRGSLSQDSTSWLKKNQTNRRQQSRVGDKSLFCSTEHPGPSSQGPPRHCRLTMMEFSWLTLQQMVGRSLS